MITVLGSINLDLIASGSHLPQPGETISGDHFTTAPGGKGANQALAAKRAGCTVYLFGAVGSDDFANQALAALDVEKVDLSHIRQVDGPTGVAIILVGGTGENMIVVIPAANAEPDYEMASAATAPMTKSDTLLLQQEIPTSCNMAALKAARAKGIRTIFNTAPFSSDTATLAANADIVVCNETEFADLTGTPLDTIETCASALEEVLKQKAKSGRQVFVLTLGAKGALAADHAGNIYRATAPAITPVDTVGAGDTFCGYLAAGFDKGLGFQEALKMAVVAGSLACLKRGAQPAIPHQKEVEAALSIGVK